MNFNSKIYVAGHNGLVGSALVRNLRSQGYDNIIVADRKLIDLRNQFEVDNFFVKERPEYVFLSAAKVGGINYNKNCPADFIRDNLLIQTNVIDAAYRNNCKKLLFLGTACIYPKYAPVPIKEEYLLTGQLEDTNLPYAIAKISGLIMCQKYSEQFGFNTLSVMPDNLYGTNDNFRPNECHVIPSFINRFIKAKEEGRSEVVCFGDGSPTREFLYSDDLADGLIFLMKHYENPNLINIGCDNEISIKELANLIKNLVGYKGEIIWDMTMPNGTPRRSLDTTKIEGLGWKAKTLLKDGLEQTINWFLKNREIYHRI